MKACPVVEISLYAAIPGCSLRIVHLKDDKKEYCVVTGDHYEVDQLGFFVPADAVVPEKLLREMWLWNDKTGKGRLAGKNGDRVRSRMIEGYLSDGLFYGAYYFHEGQRIESPSWNPAWQLGQDVSTELGITFK